MIMKKLRKSKIAGAFALALAVIVALPTMASAHCDTMDGPTIGDAKKAIETKNVNYALKWVTPENAKEISQTFELSMKVRNLSPEAKELADKYFFENLVRIHRAGESAPYTGVKPSGTPIDEKVLAADKSIEIGNLSPIEKMVPQDKMPELKERFEKVMSLKNFDVNNVEAGREYIEAYVSFFKFAEGEEEHAEGHSAETASHGTEVTEHKAEDFPLIPWSLAGVFALSTVILGFAYFKKGSYRR